LHTPLVYAYPLFRAQPSSIVPTAIKTPLTTEHRRLLRYPQSIHHTSETQTTQTDQSPTKVRCQTLSFAGRHSTCRGITHSRDRNTRTPIYEEPRLYDRLAEYRLGHCLGSTCRWTLEPMVRGALSASGNLRRHTRWRPHNDHSTDWPSHSAK